MTLILVPYHEHCSDAVSMIISSKFEGRHT